MQEFANSVAKICVEKYASLRKTGKLSDNEWTVLSGILMKMANGSLSLVSLATGTKCLGGSQITNLKPEEIGCCLSDSHAEVLARRAFIRYIYDQIDQLLTNSKSDILFINEEEKINIRDNVSFHFFSSQMPCGDCCIFAKENAAERKGEPPIKIRRVENVGNNISQPYTDEDTNMVNDIYRTGAKCLQNESKQDAHLPGVNYHVTGPLRVKPGRGDRTLSLSCSDKMAKWNILGVQGSLLSLLIPQVRLESITISGNCPFSVESMERGLFKRFSAKLQGPKILQAQIEFPHAKGQKRMQPCPSSIIWCATRESQLEVAVEGRKQGSTKKKKGKHLLVTRRALFETFLKTCDKYEPLKCRMRHPKKITYYDVKLFTEYHRMWNRLKLEIFPAWPTKPSSLQGFVL